MRRTALESLEGKPLLWASALNSPKEGCFAGESVSWRHQEDVSNPTVLRTTIRPREKVLEHLSWGMVMGFWVTRSINSSSNNLP